MGYTNSDMMEEVMVLSYQEGIIEEVRTEVKKTLETNKEITLYDAYLEAYKKFSKKNDE